MLKSEVSKFKHLPTLSTQPDILATHFFSLVNSSMAECEIKPEMQSEVTVFLTEKDIFSQICNEIEYGPPH